MSLTCPLCQTDNPDRATTCSVCGTPLQPNKTIPAAAQTQPTIPAGSVSVQASPQTGKTKSASQTFPYALPLPSTLRNDRYELQKVLGDGGFAITYKAIDIQTQQILAIKERWPVGGTRKNKEVLWKRGTKLQKEIQKFQDEAMRLQKCNHASIVQCHDFFEENNTCYIVMDFVDGQSLHSYVKQQGLLAEQTARDYLIQLAEALKVVHSQKILHRDIKPENIMLDRRSNRAVLIDFGIAREFQENITKDMTRYISLFYSPLEQLSQTTKRTASADLFSLCASFFYAVTGQDPVPVTDRMESLHIHQVDNLPAPQQLNPQISRGLQDIILTGMNIKIDDRFISAAHLLEHLNGNPIPRSLFVLRRKLANQQGQVDFQSIVQEYQTIIRNESPQSKVLPQLQAELAHIFLHLDRFNEALNAAQSAYQLDPSQPLIQGILGLIACRQGRWQDAVTFLQTAHYNDPNEPWIALYLGLALIQTQQISKAKTILQPWFDQLPQQIFPSSLQSNFQSIGAWLAFHEQDWSTAVRYSRQTLKVLRDSGDPQLQSLKSWIYPCLVLATEEAVKGKSGQDVDRCLDEFDREVPSNLFGTAYRAWHQWQLNPQGSTGAIVFMRSSQPDPSTPTWILFNQGLIAEQNQNWQEAEVLYRQCFQRSGSDSRIAGRLGWVLGQQGRWQEAFDVMDQGAIPTPKATPPLTGLETAQFWHNRGWVTLNLFKTQSRSAGRKTISAQALYTALKESYQTAIDVYRQDPNSQLQVQKIQDILNQLP